MEKNFWRKISKFCHWPSVTPLLYFWTLLIIDMIINCLITQIISCTNLLNLFAQCNFMAKLQILFQVRRILLDVLCWALNWTKNLIIPGINLFYIRRNPLRRTRLEAFLDYTNYDGEGTDVCMSGHTLVLQI